jgi:CRP/FNR family transcriptional regulator
MCQTSTQLYPDCATCSARNHSVFNGLQPVEIENLSETKGCRRYKKGEVVFYADDTPTGLFCIRKGTVKLYKVGSDGREQIIRLAKEGDILGYRSLISGDRYLKYAMPIEDAEICHIPKSTFFSLTTKSVNLSGEIMKLLADELRLAQEKMVEMARKSVRERLAETLLILKETHGVEADGTTLGIKMTREDLANMVGSAPESVSRMLSKMKDDGIIVLRGRKIAITNHKALVEAANTED